MIVNTNTSSRGTGSTSQVVSLPASLVSGNLLVIFISVKASGTITQPSGWSTLYNASFNSGASIAACFYKTSNGSEGATVTITSSSGTFSAIAYQISGWSGTPENSTVAAGSSTSADPASLTVSWGAANNLWLVVAHQHGNFIATAAPTNYGNLITSNASSEGTSSADFATASATENPGAFTNGSSPWVAYTIGVRPG